MSYSIDYAGSFKKDYKRLKKRGMPIEKLKKAIQILAETGSLPPEYRPHKLVGKYAGKWECHIDGPNSDWLMVWDQNDMELTLLMLRSGSHSDIFSNQHRNRLEQKVNNLTVSSQPQVRHINDKTVYTSCRSIASKHSIPTE